MSRKKRREPIDLTGEKIGRLTVMAECADWERPRNDRPSGVRAYWCECECGKSKLVRVGDLLKATRGCTQGTYSCGCQKIEKLENASLAHYGKKGRTDGLCPDCGIRAKSANGYCAECSVERNRVYYRARKKAALSTR
jgi:hypothetical protein